MRIRYMSLPIVLCALLIGCNNKTTKDRVSNLPEISQKQLDSYQEVGKKALAELKDATPTEKQQVRQEAIYNEVVDREYDKFAELATVTEDEVNTYLKNKNNTLPELIVVAGGNTYYVINEKDIENGTYLGMTVTESHEPNQEDIQKYVTEQIKSGKITQLLNERVQECSNLKEDK